MPTNNFTLVPVKFDFKTSVSFSQCAAELSRDCKWQLVKVLQEKISCKRLVGFELLVELIGGECNKRSASFQPRFANGILKTVKMNG